MFVKYMMNTNQFHETFRFQLHNILQQNCQYVALFLTYQRSFCICLCLLLKYQKSTKIFSYTHSQHQNQWRKEKREIQVSPSNQEGKYRKGFVNQIFAIFEVFSKQSVQPLTKYFIQLFMIHTYILENHISGLISGISVSASIIQHIQSIFITTFIHTQLSSSSSEKVTNEIAFNFFR